VISIQKLSKSYRLAKSNAVKALRSVSFEVEEGEVVAVVGPSGSGKSTFLNILGGLDFNYQGKVVIGKKELRKINPNLYRRSIVGTIFQQFYLIPSLNVEENVALPNVFSKQMTKDKLKQRVDYLLERVGLSDRKKHLPKELSGGQAQRVVIARALVASPAIVLADEPTGNLDSKTGKEIINLLFEINKEESTTMFIVTHDLGVIEGVKKKIFLKDGKIDIKAKA